MASFASETGIALADVENWTTQHQYACAVEVAVTMAVPRRSYVAFSFLLARSGHEAALSTNTPTAVTARGLAVMLLGAPVRMRLFLNSKKTSTKIYICMYF